MKSNLIEKIKAAPKDPGVYIFRGKSDVLYVGKATDLRSRLRSYLKITDLKTQSLHEEATQLETISLRSEIEALIEESRLIQELKPKYNILWRDDKSYLYVAFTRERTPKVFITHKSLNPKRYTLNPTLIGPFTDGAALRLVMKLLRRYFPYCTCFRPHLRDCLNAQIGKCFGFCCKKGVLTRQNTTEYQRNIKMIKTVLRGQSKKLLKSLEKPQEKRALEKIFEHRDYVSNDRTDRLDRDVKNSIIDPRSSKISRVECYDISNFAGKEAVGAMTVLMKHELGIKNYEWVPDKSQWRKFKIKSSPTRDDPRMIYEVVSRRLHHPEWPYPDLIIIDGGITQYRAALKAQKDCANADAKKIKIVSYPKPQKILLGWPNAPEEIKKLAEQAIYRTHNFVIRYHRQVRNKALFDIIK